MKFTIVAPYGLTFYRSTIGSAQMNALLNIKFRAKETGELFFLTGFTSHGDGGRGVPILPAVTEIGLKSCEGTKGRHRGGSFGVRGKDLDNYELFSDISDL